MTSRFVSHARRRPLGGLVVFTVLGLWTAPIDAGPLVCGPIDPNSLRNQFCVANRDVSLYVGTLSIAGVAAPPIDAVWSSDLIDATVRLRLLADTTIDSRITPAALTSYVNDSGNTVEWTLAGPDNLTSALVTQAALLESHYGPGTLLLGASTLLSGPNPYVVAQFTEFFEDPACGTHWICERTNTYVARVGVFQQNATWTPNDVPVPVPEPGTLALLGLGLAGVAVTRRRSARARVLAGNVEAATPRRTNGVRSDQSAER